jgi:uncharacterized membrane protein (DUF373 family)
MIIDTETMMRADSNDLIERRAPHTEIHGLLRRAFELAQDAIVAALCTVLLAVMLLGLWTLFRYAFIDYQEPTIILSQIVLLLVLVELYRTLIFYLHEHRISVSLMLEGTLVGELRQVLLNPPTAAGYQSYGNALLLAVLGGLLIAFRVLSRRGRARRSAQRCRYLRPDTVRRESLLAR